VSRERHGKHFSEFSRGFSLERFFGTFPAARVRGIVIVNLLSRSIFPVSENITLSMATSLAETYFLSIVLSLARPFSHQLAYSFVREGLYICRAAFHRHDAGNVSSLMEMKRSQ